MSADTLVISVDNAALERIGAAIANTLGGAMSTEQIEELLDYDEQEEGRTLWECLVSWAVTTIVGSVPMRHVAFMHDPPADQRHAGGAG